MITTIETEEKKNSEQLVIASDRWHGALPNLLLFCAAKERIHLMHVDRQTYNKVLSTFSLLSLAFIQKINKQILKGLTVNDLINLQLVSISNRYVTFLYGKSILTAAKHNMRLTKAFNFIPSRRLTALGAGERSTDYDDQMEAVKQATRQEILNGTLDEKQIASNIDSMRSRAKKGILVRAVLQIISILSAAVGIVLLAYPTVSTTIKIVTCIVLIFPLCYLGLELVDACLNSNYVCPTSDCYQLFFKTPTVNSDSNLHPLPKAAAITSSRQLPTKSATDYSNRQIV